MVEQRDEVLLRTARTNRIVARQGREGGRLVLRRRGPEVDGRLGEGIALDAREQTATPCTGRGHGKFLRRRVGVGLGASNRNGMRRKTVK